MAWQNGTENLQLTKTVIDSLYETKTYMLAKVRNFHDERLIHYASNNV